MEIITSWNSRGNSQADILLDSLSTASGAEGTLSRSLELFSKWTQDNSKVFGKKLNDDFKKLFKLLQPAGKLVIERKSSKYSWSVLAENSNSALNSDNLLHIQTRGIEKIQALAYTEYNRLPQETS